MAYQAIIARLKNVRSHPNADRVQLATVLGTQVVIGLNATEDQLGVMFFDDGQLSEKMAAENNLFSKPEMNADKSQKGYFGKNSRVRAQKFRGEKSYGFWIELSSLAWTGVNLDKLEEGFTFTHIHGEEVCRKYINPATLRMAHKNKQKNQLSTKIRKRYSQLKEHFDTKQLRYEIGRIPENSILYITSKIHGTSGRTGNIYAKQPLTTGKMWWNNYFWWLKKYEYPQSYQIVSGTRRVVLNPEQTTDNGFYSGKTFRIDIHNRIKEAGLPEGVTLYYEISGFDEQGRSIMPMQSVNKINDKKLKKLVKTQYGDLMTFSYGCKADEEDPSKRYRVNVYRATVTNTSGEVYELSWPQVKNLCTNLGLETVPELRGPIIYKGHSLMSEDWEYYGNETSEEQLLSLVESFLDKPETLDKSHIREGVCVRAEMPNGTTKIMKSKGFLFRVLEGLVKDDPDVTDTEEIEDLQKERSDSF